MKKWAGKLDQDFIHPRFADKLLADDEARIDHDWYSYKTLLFWVFTKADPFGVGTVKDVPNADRQWRMENKLYCNANSVATENDYKNFIRRGFGRIGINIQTFIRQTSTSGVLRREPLVIIDEFSKLTKDKLRCKNKIFKRSGQELVEVVCDFAQLSRTVPCEFCGHIELDKLDYNQASK